jgi:transglutaminase-like putative cysteine protease
MALHLGQGVCQDYAHIMLSLLRTLTIPARYVSGHLLGEGAPHAWVEALVRDAGTGDVDVVGCDPTHRCHVGADYIVVATGRDFADVTSTSGVFTGAASGKLHWSKHASKLQESVTSAA